MTEPRRILLGIITGAHGIRGDVVVKSFADVPQDIAAYGPLSTEDGRRSFTLDVVNVMPKGVVVRIDGIRDRNAAEALKGMKLFVSRDALPAADPGEYYFEDLIGLDAFASDGSALGSVVAMHDFGAGPLIEIALAAKPGRTELLPFTDAVVPSVDMAARRLTIELPATTEARPDDSLEGE